MVLEIKRDVDALTERVEALEGQLKKMRLLVKKLQEAQKDSARVLEEAENENRLTEEEIEAINLMIKHWKIYDPSMVNCIDVLIQELMKVSLLQGVRPQTSPHIWRPPNTDGNWLRKVNTRLKRAGLGLRLISSKLRDPNVSALVITEGVRVKGGNQAIFAFASVDHLQATGTRHNSLCI